MYAYVHMRDEMQLQKGIHNRHSITTEICFHQIFVLDKFHVICIWNF